MTRSGWVATAIVACVWLANLASPDPARAGSDGAARGAARSARPRVQLSVDTPQQGALVGDPEGMAFIAGNASASFGQASAFDIVVVIDRSESTSSPSGADANGDGVVDSRTCPGGAARGWFGALLGGCKRTADSVLATELRAVRTLLGQLDPRTTQVGIVAFSGDRDPRTPDAYVSSTLTSEYAQVEKALDQIGRSGPQGSTNMLEAMQLATVELIGTASASGKPRRGARKIMLFLSDGLPTLPIEQATQQNQELTLEAAVKAHKLGIRIDSYGIGPDALGQPVALVEMARVTDGIFTPVSQPRDLQSIFEQVDFSSIDVLRVANRTRQAQARSVLRNPDGSFAALLELAPGDNTIEVYAHSTAGAERVRTLRVRYLPEAQPQTLSPRQVAQRSRLLQNRLTDLQDENLTVQPEKDEERRRDLQLRIEAERKSAEERVRDVRIEAERSSAPGGGPAGGTP